MLRLGRRRATPTKKKKKKLRVNNGDARQLMVGLQINTKKNHKSEGCSEISTFLSDFIFWLETFANKKISYTRFPYPTILPIPHPVQTPCLSATVLDRIRACAMSQHCVLFIYFTKLSLSSCFGFGCRRWHITTVCPRSFEDIKIQQMAPGKTGKTSRHLHNPNDSFVSIIHFLACKCIDRWNLLTKSLQTPQPTLAGFNESWCSVDRWIGGSPGLTVVMDRVNLLSPPLPCLMLLPFTYSLSWILIQTVPSNSPTKLFLSDLMNCSQWCVLHSRRRIKEWCMGESIEFPKLSFILTLSLIRLVLYHIVAVLAICFRARERI